MLHHITSSRAATKQGIKIGMANKRRSSHVYQTFRHEIKHQTNILHQKNACSYQCMTYLTYLTATQQLWHYARICECMFIALKQGKHKINPNYNM